MLFNLQLIFYISVCFFVNDNYCGGKNDFREKHLRK